MQDINNMSLYDYNQLYSYISRREKIRKKEPVTLRQSNIDMINRTKNKEKKIVKD